MKKGILTIALVAAMALLTVPAQAAWDEPYTLLTSAELTANAWEALGKGTATSGGETGYQKAIKWAKICTLFYGPRANVQTPYTGTNVIASYTQCWALNDVGTCFYIMGEGYREDGALNNNAKAAYHRLTTDTHTRPSEPPHEYFDSRCADPTAAFLWKPADAAYARLKGFTGTEASSAGLTAAAWAALTSGNYVGAVALGELCIDMFKNEAENQKTRAKDYHDIPGSATIEGLYNECYAYCDVAACWFIKAEALRKGMIGTKSDCILIYQAVDSAGANNPASDNLPYGCVAMDGAATTDLVTQKSWKVSEAADDRIAVLNETLWNDSLLRY